MGRLLDYKEAADYLGIGEWVLRGLAKRGEVKVLQITRKTIRFDVRDLDAFVRRTRQRSQPS
ncbi:MAG: helix-turn-helix domain-containing protein [Actinomycetota bacterium]|nr:helix-turn-helix domain-containing protein [Actinomycetota bacterium]